MNDNRYDYHYHMMNDIIEYLSNNRSEIFFQLTEDNFDEIYDELLKELFLEDSVTGNASGSYTCSKWVAEENLCHNLDILINAIEDDYVSPDVLLDPEVADLTIRCYILPAMLHAVLTEILNTEE